MTRSALLAHAWAQLGLWLAIAVVAAHLASAVGVRLDVTDDQRHSLSPTTVGVVAGLQEPLTATVWFTEDLGAPYHNHRQALIDLLAELEAVSGGQLDVVLRDPSGSPEVAGAAKAAGIRPVTWAARDYDQTVARQVWMGLSLDQGTRHAAIDALPAVERMEAELVAALIAVTTEADDRKTVGWLQGNGEPALGAWPEDHPLGRLRVALQTRYEVVAVDPSEGPIPDGMDAILVVGPQLTVGEPTQRALDAFLMRGGALGLFLAEWQPDFEGNTVRAVPHGLHETVGRWGIGVGRSLLIDRRRNEAMAVPSGGRVVRANTPLAPTSTAFDRVLGPVRDLPRATLPFAVPLTLEQGAGAQTEGAVWLWAESTARSVPSVPSLDPAMLGAELPGEQAGRFAVVASVQGAIDSAFPDEGVARSAPTRLVVAGSADLVANNPDLVLNATDWLLADSRLASVRARSAGPRPLEAPDNPTVVKLGIVGVAFGGLALLALIGWRR